MCRLVFWLTVYIWRQLKSRTKTNDNINKVFIFTFLPLCAVAVGLQCFILTFCVLPFMSEAPDIGHRPTHPTFWHLTCTYWSGRSNNLLLRSLWKLVRRRRIFPTTNAYHSGDQIKVPYIRQQSNIVDLFDHCQPTLVATWWDVRPMALVDHHRNFHR